MFYNYISVKNSIARIIRNVDNQLPAHFLDSMLEWIPEAIEELETPYQLVTKSTPTIGKEGAIYTHQHVASLPCGIMDLLAVEDEYGKRLRSGMDVTDITNQSTRYHNEGPNSSEDYARSTNFETDVVQTVGFDPNTSIPGSQTPWDGSNLVSTGSPAYSKEYYKIQGGCIQTSKPEMFIKIHYKAIPVDHEGYPLVPDVTEYKEALYWYVLGKLIAAGFKHPIIPNDLTGIKYCTGEYERYAGRALGIIAMPNQDKMARLRDGFSQRLIPPQHFYDDFNIEGEQIQTIITQ